MSMADSPGFGCDPDPDAGKVCDCLSCALESIAESTARIAAALEERLKGPCDSIQECIDDIIQGINDRYSGGLATCEQCQNMLAQGLGGTLEYAMRCASVTCDECEEVCSLTNEGQCCKTCGQEKCICHDGVCVPVDEPEPEDKDKAFVGWCNPTSKVVAVTKQGEPSPGPGFVQAALSETEQVAFLEAQSYCDSIEPFTEPTPLPEIPPAVNYPAPLCDLGGYSSGANLDDIASNAPGRKTLASLATITTRVRQIGFEGLNLGLISDVVQGIGNYFTSGIPLVSDDYIPSVAALLGCNNTAFVESAKVLAAAGLAKNLAGVDFGEFLTPYRYAMNASCRQKQLDPDKAIAAYLGHAIDEKQLDTYWGISGVCNPALNHYLKAARSKPTPLQLAVMRHRQIIGQSDYHTRMRELGYLEQGVREELFDITRQVPTLTDIIRFMVRDTDDEKLVARFGLDDAFTEKYGGQLQRWSQDQGIPEIVAKYAWRAHWTIPPPTQLFQFWHRLRKNPEFGTEAEQLDDIKAALIQQDILPYWHDRILAISFRPMRLRDIRRSFQIGTLSEQEVREQFQFLGYNDKTVDLMTDFVKRLRDNSVRAHPLVKQWYRLEISRERVVNRLTSDGIPLSVVNDALDDVEPEFSKSVWARAFIRGDLHIDAFRAALQTAGVSGNGINRIIELTGLQIRHHPALRDLEVGVIDESDAITQMLDSGIPGQIAGGLATEVERDIERKFIVTCQNGIKRRFMLGELTAGEAIAELSNRKTTNSRAARMVDWWGCELKESERHVSANTLCEWLARGAITGPDFLSRLEKIGYSDADAALMLEDCLIKIDARRLKQMQKDAKDEAAEQQRRQRAIERANREVIKQQNQLAAARKRQANNRIRRIKQMHGIVDKLTDKLGGDTGDTYIFAEGQRKRIETDFSLTVDLALQTLVLAAEEFAGESQGELPPLIDEIAARVALSDIPGTDPQLIPASGNGQSG